MAPRNTMSKKEKQTALEMFKAHYSAKETAKYFSFGYATIRGLFRGYENADIKKYDRTLLIQEASTIDRITQQTETNI